MSNLLDEVEVLRRIPLFCGIEPAKLKLIAFSSERLTFEQGQELFHQGDPGDAAYVIVSGTVDVLVTNRGETTRVASFARNDIIGGQVQMMFDTLPTMKPNVDAGLVRALGTSGAERSPIMPRTSSSASLETRVESVRI